MNIEKFTDRSRGFIQSAQTLAVNSDHQRLTPEHLLKVLLDDKEGLAAGLIRAAGGDPAAALKGTEAALAKLPSVEGAGAGQVHPTRELVRFFEQAEQLAEKAGDNFVTAERMLIALALSQDNGAANALFGAYQGWPLSTTHCQIGATVGVGLFEGLAGVNCKVFLKCVFGWVITLVVVGTTTALLVGPSPEPLKGEYCDNYCQVNSREWMQ